MANQGANTDMYGQTMADETDKAPWTIKSVPVDTRKSAVAAASRRGETMAEWVSRAVDAQCRVEKNDGIFPPVHHQATPEGLPAQSSLPVGLPAIELGGLAQALEAFTHLAQARGEEVPRSVFTNARTVLNMHLRMARGLPPSPRRSNRSEQTEIDDVVQDVIPAPAPRQITGRAPSHEPVPPAPAPRPAKSRRGT